jgi:long-chain acyl-CoA synthetase
VKAQWELAKLLILDKMKAGLGGELRIAVTGGAALDVEVQHFFTDIGIPVIEGYGLTETSPMALAERYAPTEKLQGGLTPIPEVEVAVVVPGEDAPLDSGQEGELIIRGPNVMVGYYNLPKETAGAFVSVGGDSFFRTGDLATIDAGGKVAITGRVKELYKLDNGKYVVPGKVEDKIVLSNPYILQAFIYGADRPYNVALLSVDYRALAEHLGLAFTTSEEMSTDRRIIEALQDGLEAAKIGGKSFEWPKRIMCLAEEFTVLNGFLTPKMSMKRNVIQKHFQSRLDDLYID